MAVSLFLADAQYEVFAGRLYVRNRRESLTVNPWGAGMGAWLLRGLTTTDAVDLELDFQRLARTRTVWSDFLLSRWPEEAMRAVSALPGGHWNLLRLANHGERAFVELLESSPALGAALGWTVQRGRDVREAAQLAGLKRRRILGALGFEASERLVRTFSRIPAAEASPELLEMLAGADVREMSHWPRVTGRAVALAANAELAALTTARFRREFAEAADDTQRQALEALQRAAWGVEIHAVRLEPFDHLEALGRQAGDARRILARVSEEREAARRFQPPPVPPGPGMEAISDVRALRAEGEQMHHCCASYQDRVRAGEVYFYRMLEPERLTVSIEKRAGKWVVGQVRGAGNRLPAMESLGRLWEWTGEAAEAVREAPRVVARVVERRRRRRWVRDERQLALDFG